MCCVLWCVLFNRISSNATENTTFQFIWRRKTWRISESEIIVKVAFLRSSSSLFSLWVNEATRKSYNASTYGRNIEVSALHNAEAVFPGKNTVSSSDKPSGFTITHLFIDSFFSRVLLILTKMVLTDIALYRESGSC